MKEIIASEPQIATAHLRGFEKGLADRGGWHEEIFPMPEVQASFFPPP